MPQSKLLVLLTLASSAFACTAPGGPDKIKSGFWSPPDASSPDDTGIAVVTPELKCRETKASEVMVARSTITTGTSMPISQPTYFTANLFGQFKAVCGGCHVESSLGSFSVGASNFATKVDQHTLDVITSNDPKVFMPPAASGGVPFDTRSDTDAVKQLAALMTLWINQHRPADSFVLPAPEGAGAASGYALSPELGATLTNIGTCVPDKGMIATNGGAMDALDTMFAAATELPPTLDKTDLFTLDSEALAREGVISYAPTYPLWTDNAGKMRYVRVPRGKSIAFDKATQTFHIPANTRFYKTFLKEVTDATGTLGYRKIETRVIVSRPDESLPDGSAKQTALYGTYVWNEDESQATLLIDPLRNGKPFADRIFSYVTDEEKAQPIIDAAPKNLLLKLSEAGVTRHYALPGAERCVGCHMGSPSQSFILGFTPLQVNPRAADTGGLYHTPTGEELTQLQRLIDYGVISGMTSPNDVLTLEKSQGTRAPRTPEELNAQAYMIGNCSHCHNPRGLPSVKEPAVKAALDFLPGPGANEGIFQFPLDRVSPIRKRGLYQDTDIPYITPSLYDLPQETAKFFCPDRPNGSCVYENTNMDPDIPPPPIPELKFVLAPWRSLIYRNVDTPYDYFDDYALYPHMPLNSPGYDCRVANLMGDWMVSIPAVLKDPNKFEDARPSITNLTFGDLANRDPQPYREVKTGDPEFDAAVTAAKSRLDRYHDGGYRYNFCPDSYTRDIVDSAIDDAVSRNLPIQNSSKNFTDPKDPSKVLMPLIAPASPHYVALDDTDPPGLWFPRRPDWEQALGRNADIPAFVAAAVKTQLLTADETIDLTNVLNALVDVRIADVREPLLRELPFGLWNTARPGCDFTSARTAGSFKDAERPTWMDVTPPPASAPVFVQSAGAAVFTTICFNCHGVNADSKGLLAEEISTLTGGDARVANFREGLFGPSTAPGENRTRVFGAAAATLGGGVTSDDLGARYLAWMALGGTAKHLPADVLTQVAQAPVFDHLRANISPQGTPDMLRLGLQLCAQVAMSDKNTRQISPSELFGKGYIAWGNFTGLVDSTGDAEMWLRLCSLGNRPIVHVLFPSSHWTASTTVSDLSLSGFRQYWGDTYGSNPALDASGSLTTIANSTFPLCVNKPNDPAELTSATQWLGAHKVRGNVIPFCPAGLVSPDHQLQFVGDEFTDGRKWAARGAINAALAVFLYLDQIERDPSKRQPLYNQCELLGKR